MLTWWVREELHYSVDGVEAVRRPKLGTQASFALGFEERKRRVGGGPGR